MTTPMVFFKEVKYVGGSALSIPAAWLFFWYVLHYFALEFFFGSTGTEKSFLIGLVVGLFMFNAIVGVVAGNYFMAEETNAGTDAFLFRLPMSCERLYGEKLLGGLLCLSVLYLITLIYLNQFDLDLAFPERPDQWGSIASNLFLLMFSCYVVAVVLSRYTSNSLTILFATLGIECLFIVILMVAVGIFRGEATFADIIWKDLLQVISWGVICFVIPILAIWQKWQLSLKPEIWGAPENRTLLKGLVWKSVSENLISHIMCVAVFAGTIVWVALGGGVEAQELIGSEVPYLGAVILILGYILVSALGSSAYSTEECDGLNCILYHHPIPRRQLLLAKVMAALPSFVLIAFSIAIAYPKMPVVSVVIFTLLAFVIALGTKLYMVKPVPALLTSMTISICVFMTIWMWMVPREYPVFFKGFQPVNDVWLVGAAPAIVLLVGGFTQLWFWSTGTNAMSLNEDSRRRYHGRLMVYLFAITCALMWVLRQVVEL